MALEHLLTAWCDAPGVALHGIALDPNTTQAFIDLGNLGWRVVTTDDETKIYCPKHKEA